MSNDDLQSLNKKLTDLNDQLRTTVERERTTCRSLRNILDSTEVPILVLDADLNIRFLTPAGRSLFTVVAPEVGQPLADLSRRLEDENLLSDAWSVLESHTPVRRKVSVADGGWFIRAMFPYRSNGGDVEGVVVTFVDISETETR